MKINLRKASEISKVLKFEVLAKLHANANAFSNLNVSALNSDIRAIHAERTEGFNDSLNKVIVVTEALYQLRDLVNEAKQRVGINSLLCQMESLTSQIGFLTRFEQPVGASSVEDKLSIIEQQFTQNRLNPESRSYGSNAQIKVLLSEDDAQYLTDIKKQLKSIKNDQLLTLNIKTEVELTSELVEVLTALDLL